MSGHSKWATIHRQKEVKDTKRGAIFTKLGRAITVAVKAGGGVGDSDKNFRLRLAIEKARQFNMPKENISRSVERGMGAGEESAFDEATYEGFAPGGRVAVLVHVLTDNRLRTAQQVREIFDRSGGVMVSLGAVGYLFAQKEELIIKCQALNLKSQDEQELEIIDLGIEDIEIEGKQFIVYCDKNKSAQIREQLTQLGYEIVSCELVMKPKVLIEVVNEEERTKIEIFLEKLEELDDVQKVWTNYS